MMRKHNLKRKRSVKTFSKSIHFSAERLSKRISNLTNTIQTDQLNQQVVNDKDDQLIKLVNVIFPKINLSLVKDVDYDLITDLLEETEFKDSDFDDSDDDDDFEYSIDELRNDKADDSLIKEFFDYTNNELDDQSDNVYYTYLNAFLNEKKDVKVFYGGKGKDERCLTAFRIAHACFALKIRPITKRTRFIFDKLTSRTDMIVIKTHENVKEKTAFAIESAAFKIDYGFKQSNILKSSINLDQFKLKNLNVIVKNLNVLTIENLYRGLESDQKLVMNVDNLQADYEQKYEAALSKLNRDQLDEFRIKKVVITRDFLYNFSLLNDRQKLAIFIQVLIFLNDGVTLSNKGIITMLNKLGDQTDRNIDTYSYFNLNVLELLYSTSATVRLLERLNAFNQSICNGDLNEFRALIEKIVLESRKTIEESKENVRMIQRRFSCKEVYTIKRILEISQENNQLLKWRSNHVLYVNVLGEEAVHNWFSVNEVLVNIRDGNVIYSNFDSLADDVKEAIDRSVKVEYEKLVADKDNHKQKFIKFDHLQRYAIYCINQLNIKFKSDLTYLEYFEVFKHSLGIKYDDGNLTGRSVAKAIKNLSNNILKDVNVEEERKLEIDRLAEEKYSELVSKQKKAKVKLTNFTDETKYVAQALINRANPPSNDNIIRIVEACKIGDRKLSNISLERVGFYVKQPIIDQDSKAKFDRIIETEMDKIKNVKRPKFNARQAANHQHKRNIINGIADHSDIKSETFKKAIERFNLKQSKASQ